VVKQKLPAHAKAVERLYSSNFQALVTLKCQQPTADSYQLCKNTQ